MRLPQRRLYTIGLPSGHTLSLGGRTLVMGILNVTPDSFAEPVSRASAAAAVDRAFRLEAEGADIIDLGGESTRPGAVPVPADEELNRVLPVLRGVAGRLRIPVSIDTYKASVARAALAEGASIVNDVSGLRYEPALSDVVAGAQAALVIMHMRGRPATMYAEAAYQDVVAEVTAELGQSIDAAVAAGVRRDRIVADPGIGFAKAADHSYGVLTRLAQVSGALDCPVLSGPSRKSFMREALADRPAIDRDWGTAAAVTASVLEGAHIVRVHAVAEMVQVVRVADAIRIAAEAESR